MGVPVAADAHLGAARQSHALSYLIPQPSEKLLQLLPRAEAILGVEGREVCCSQ
jgi:hypothetical protein